MVSIIYIFFTSVCLVIKSGHNTWFLVYCDQLDFETLFNNRHNLRCIYLALGRWTIWFHKYINTLTNSHAHTYICILTLSQSYQKFFNLIHLNLFNHSNLNKKHSDNANTSTSVTFDLDVWPCLHVKVKKSLCH